MADSLCHRSFFSFKGIYARPSLMGSELRSQSFDLAKFQEIIPRNTCYEAFFSWNLASVF